MAGRGEEKSDGDGVKYWDRRRRGWVNQRPSVGIIHLVACAVGNRGDKRHSLPNWESVTSHQSLPAFLLHPVFLFSKHGKKTYYSPDSMLLPSPLSLR